MKRENAKQMQILKSLRDEILSGRHAMLSAFPSETALSRRFGVGRSTISRVMDILEREGLVSRQQGRGTFVTRAGALRKIGLLLPGMAYSEFFPPVASAISLKAQENGYSLVLGDITSKDPARRAERAKDIARTFVKAGVSGVIYQPLELIDRAEATNREIVSIFDAADIAVVLLDYDIVSRPNRSGYDIVGINNYDAGYRLASHLLAAGARKIDFQLSPNASRCRIDRFRGVQAAVAEHGGARSRALVTDPTDVAALRRHLRRGRPDAFICSSDRLAAQLKLSLGEIGLRVPDDILLAGFNDVQIASFLTPPLTTVRQPCSEIGNTAFRLLVERLNDGALPPREVLLDAPLVTRASTQRAVAGNAAHPKFHSTQKRKR